MGQRRYTPQSVLASTALALVASCGDAELQVRFEVPAPYLDQIAQSSLQLLEPPRAQPFDCEALAFREISEELLRLSLTQEVFASTEAVDLNGVDRRSTKLLLAQAWTEDGSLAVAGCVEVGLVDGLTKVTIKGEPAAEVAGRSPLPDDGSLPSHLSLALVDVLDQPLPAAQTRWKVVSASGLVTSGEAASGAEGVVELSVPYPDAPGPALLWVAARWHEGAALRIAGFEPTEVVSLTFSSTMPGPPIHKEPLVGRLGPGGQLGQLYFSECSEQSDRHCSNLVLFDATLGELEREETEIDQPAEPTTTVPACLLRGPESDQVAVVSAEELLLYSPGLGWIPQSLQPPWVVQPTGIFNIGDCAPSGGEPPLMLVWEGGETSWVLDLDGVSARSDFTPFVTVGRWPVAAGCVSVDGEGPQRLLVVTDGTDRLRFYLRDREIVDIPFGLARPLRFVPASMEGLPSGLLMAKDVGTGQQLAMLELRRADSELRLVEVESQPFGWQAEAVYSGDFDGDGRRDYCGLLQTSEFYNDWNASVILAAEVAGERLAASLSLGDELASFPSLSIGDFDGDRVDDLLVRTTRTGGSPVEPPLPLPGPPPPDPQDPQDPDGPPPMAETTDLRLYRMGLSAR